MPDERRPGGVGHPLDYAGGEVLVAAVSFVHGALVVVGHSLGFALEVVERCGSTIALFERVAKNVDGGETLAASVEIPIVVDGPEMVLGNELDEAFFWGDRRARAGFRIVTPRAASFGVGEPIDGRDVLVRTGHFDAGGAGNFRGRCRSRRNRGIGPFEILEDVEIHSLDLGWRRIVAA